MVKLLKLFCAAACSMTIAALATPAFQTISLSEFGAIVNQNSSLHPQSLITAPGATFRTNDFQTLEQSFDNTRLHTRVGSFYVSSAPYLGAQDPGGPGLNYPGSCNNSSSSITTPTQDVLFIFSSTEVNGGNTYQRLAELQSSETLLIHYTLASDQTKFITDYSVTGNAYHDIQYSHLTPLVSFRAAVTSVAVDGVNQSGPFNNKTLTAGTKLRLGLNNGQTWLLYVEQSGPVAFTINQNNNGFQATAPMNGFLRVAIVQPTAVPTTNNVVACPDGSPAPCMDWSTSAIIQTLPPNPFNMYMLWPYQWVPKAGNQLKTFLEQNHFSPSCSIISQLLPVLAETDLNSAIDLFNQLAPDSFDDGVNPFTTYFNMLMASKMSSEIQSYQTANRAYPTYNISATAESVEAVFDTYRHCIPTFADILFDGGTYYSWTYKVIGSTTVPPLVIFPSYKTLAPGYAPIQGFINMDSVKGPIYAAPATGKLMRFQEGAFPNWFNYFFPAVKFTSSEITTLLNLFTMAQAETIQPNNSYFQGKNIYRMALSMQYGLEVMSQAGFSKADMMSATQGIINQIKNEFQNWLIVRANPGQNDGYFIGDSTTPGICAVSGMLDPAGGCDAPAPGCSQDDFGNAYYNDHHFHYGYWLNTAAILINWDEKFQPQNAWIAQMQSANGGSGTFKMKYFVDMFWRDSRNPAKDDIFNYNRHANSWEGHSTANGMLCCLYGDGRNQESLAEDFHSWLGTSLYARAIQSCSALTSEDKAGFSTLQSFSDTNLKMTATAGKLWYQDDNWIYGGPFGEANITVGNQWDSKVDYATWFAPGPACNVTAP